MNNPCVFSPDPDRIYRYLLIHDREDLFVAGRRRLLCVGLNPSAADEQQLDNTLTSARDFASRWGFNGFVMANLFAFRSPYPEDLHTIADPIGPDNDRHIRAAAGQCEMVLAAWGSYPLAATRAPRVEAILCAAGRPIHCLGLTKDGYPLHPLYINRLTLPVVFRAAATQGSTFSAGDGD